jgi:hypothetical protein
MSDDLTIRVDGEEYVLRREGGEVLVGRRNGEDVVQLEDVDASLLTDEARAALDRGDTSDEALLTALRGIVSAEVERGG